MKNLIGRRKVMASDNEDSDEEDDKASSDSSDDESQITPVPQKTASYQMLNKARATPVTLTQQPSSDDDDDDESATQHKEKAVGNIHGKWSTFPYHVFRQKNEHAPDLFPLRRRP